jgi:hypothetical protein
MKIFKIRRLVFWIGAYALIMSCTPAIGASDVWALYGWGPNGWSSGIDQIARKVRTLRGVGAVHVTDYRNTQQVYEQMLASHNALTCIGYSCGGNACLAIGNSLAHNGRNIHIIMLQPSVWCGRYPTTANMTTVQDTWSYGSLWLGAYQPEGPPAGYTTFIERREPHGAADTDPQYQRDAIAATAVAADPSRQQWYQRYLQRSAPFVDRQDATVIWRRE